MSVGYYEHLGMVFIIGSTDKLKMFVTLEIIWFLFYKLICSVCSSMRTTDTFYLCRVHEF